MSSPVIDTTTVVCSDVENADIFPHENILHIGQQPPWQKAIKGKLWSFFGLVEIKLASRRISQIKATFKRDNIQLLHVHFGTYAVFFLEICKELNIPMIVTFHGFDISSAFNRWPAYRKKFPELLQQIKYAVVISEEMKHRMVASGCPADKVRVSYLGVPTDEFSYHDRSDHTGPVKFLHAGRLTAKKGVPDLVRAFARAFGETGGAELWIAGDGEEKQMIVNTINECNVESRVKMFGKTSNEQMMQLRKDADVFVLNCRTDTAGTKEGLPIATLEAAATGLPAVTTFHAGIPESVVNGRTGILADEFDNEGLAAAMLKMMDENTRLTMGRNARKFMEEKFSLEQCNAVLKNIYAEAITNNN